MGNKEHKRYDDDTHQAGIKVTGIDIYIRMAELLFPTLLANAYRYEQHALTKAISENYELLTNLQLNPTGDKVPNLPHDDAAFNTLHIDDFLIPDDERTRGLLPIVLRPYLLTLLEEFLNAVSKDKQTPFLTEAEKNYWWKRLAGAPKDVQFMALHTAGVNLLSLLVPSNANQSFSINENQAIDQERLGRVQLKPHINLTDWDKVTRKIRSQDKLYNDIRILPLLDCFALVITELGKRGQLDALYALMRHMYLEDTEICHVRDRHAIIALVCPFDGLNLSLNKKQLRKQLRYTFMLDMLKQNLGLTTLAEENKKQGLTRPANETNDMLRLAEDTPAFNEAFRTFFLPWILKNEIPHDKIQPKHSLLRLLIPEGQILATKLKAFVDQEFERVFGEKDADTFYQEDAILGMTCQFSPLLVEMYRWFKRHATFYHARVSRWQGANNSRQALALQVIEWLQTTFIPSGAIQSGTSASSSDAPAAPLLSMKDGFYVISRVFEVFNKLDELEASYFSVFIAYDASERESYQQAKQFIQSLLTAQNLISCLYDIEGYQALLRHVVTLETFHTRMNTEGLEALLATFLTDWKKADEEQDNNTIFQQRSALWMALVKLVYADEQQQNPNKWTLFLSDEKIQYYNEVNQDGDMAYEATVSWITRVILVALNRTPDKWTPIFYTEVQKVKTAIETGFYQPDLDAKQTALKQETHAHAYPDELIKQLTWVMSQYVGPREVLIDMSPNIASTSLSETVVRSQQNLTPKKTERPPLYLLTPCLFTTKDSYLLASYFCYHPGHDEAMMQWLLNPARGFNPNGMPPKNYQQFFNQHQTPLVLAQAFNKATLVTHLESLGANLQGNTPLHLIALGQLSNESIPLYAWQYYLNESNTNRQTPLHEAIRCKNLTFAWQLIKEHPDAFLSLDDTNQIQVVRLAKNCKCYDFVNELLQYLLDGHDFHTKRLMYMLCVAIEVSELTENQLNILNNIFIYFIERYRVLFTSSDIVYLLGTLISLSYDIKIIIELIHIKPLEREQLQVLLSNAIKAYKEINEPGHVSSVNVINLLVEKSREFNASRDRQDEPVTHPALLAIKHEKPELVDRLWTEDIISHRDECGDTILHSLLTDNMPPIYFDRLSDADLTCLINVPNKDNCTLLHFLAVIAPRHVDWFYRLCSLDNVDFSLKINSQGCIPYQGYRAVDIVLSRLCSNTYSREEKQEKLLPLFYLLFCYTFCKNVAIGSELLSFIKEQEVSAESTKNMFSKLITFIQAQPKKSRISREINTMIKYNMEDFAGDESYVKMTMLGLMLTINTDLLSTDSIPNKSKIIRLLSLMGGVADMKTTDIARDTNRETNIRSALRKYKDFSNKYPGQFEPLKLSTKFLRTFDVIGTASESSTSTYSAGPSSSSGFWAGQSSHSPDENFGIEEITSQTATCSLQ